MLKRRVGVCALVSVSLLLAVASVWLASPAQAHYRQHHYFWGYVFHPHYWHQAFHPRWGYAYRRVHVRAYRAAAYADHPPVANFAAIVVDGNSGRVLYARNADEPRHPASITKVMTLYLLFEQLEKGRLHLNSRLTISEHAARQAPTKLGLAPGATISVDDAIKAIVTLSANDIAVAVAERIGGSEDNFAALMTRQAHALGMSHTHYANASGLPNDEQITTAADLALLGRAIQERFPRYYHYFSTRSFAYDGIVNRNHNHLLGRIAGLDGIKTGYTRESGFNLLTSVKRDGHFILAVVMGSPTAAGRDRMMAGLIANEIDKGSRRHTAAPLAAFASQERAPPRPEPKGVAQGLSQPALPARLSIDRLPVASIAPAPLPRPAFVSSTPANQPLALGSGTFGLRHLAYDGSTERPSASTTTPSMLRWAADPAPIAASADAEKAIANATPARGQGDAVLGKDARIIAASREPESSQDAEPPAIARSGWMIQIGATDDAAAASELLVRAEVHLARALPDAQPFTQKVQKGEQTLYRARFAGLEDADNAELACKSLRRSGFACFATKN